MLCDFLREDVLLDDDPSEDVLFLPDVLPADEPLEDVVFLPEVPPEDVAPDVVFLLLVLLLPVVDFLREDADDVLPEGLFVFLPELPEVLLSDVPAPGMTFSLS